MRVRMGVVSAALVVLAACGGGSGGTSVGSSSTAVPKALAAGQEGTRDQVPWEEVGPGWLLALWNSAPAPTVEGEQPAVSPNDKTTLYLVDPAGGRYAITTMATTAAQQLGSLVDWSGNGHSALFSGSTGTDTVKTHLTEIQIGTGDMNAFDVDGSSSAAGYTRPQGKAILVSIDGERLAATTVRFDVSGERQATYPTSFPTVGQTVSGFLEDPDGTTVVLAAMKGIVAVDNNGAHPHELPVPGATEGCRPLRWWDDATVLTSCGSPSRLWLVPTGGAAPRALTAPLDNNGPDLGDLDAWRVASGTYVQDAGPCGYQYLAKLGPDGKTTKVTVPGVDADRSVYVKGAHESKLAVISAFSCGASDALAWFDPAANQATPLLGPPVNGGSVTDARPFPEP